ncbi:MAG: GtrA family protein [Nocardioides sp.]
MRTPSAPARAEQSLAGRFGPKVLRYFGGSVVATACSELAFVVLYGPLDVGTTWASVLGWLAGAVPNYWLNRAWTWQRSGRPSFRRELLPYLVIIGVTLALATGVTHGLDALLRSAGTSASLRVTLVAVAFFGVYVVMFVLRFLLLDRLFARLAAQEDPHPTPQEETHD